MKILSFVLGASLLTGAAFAFQSQESADGAAIRKQLPSYPVNKCLVSDEPLDAMGEPIDYLHEGRLVRFCCKGCVKQFKKDPQAVLAQIDAKVIEKQKASYPLETCPISGEKLGAMGDPIDYVHETRLVRFCCKGCIKAFEKTPGKAMAQIDAAYIEQQLASYPLETCPVSGEKLGGMGKPIDYLYGTRLVRFCCKGCMKELKKDPKSILAKIDAAAKQEG